MIQSHKLVKVERGQTAYFCGDLHGDLDALKRAIKHSGFIEGRDLLFLLGDVIDRGPNSAELIEFATCTQGVHSVLGNHEQMFLEALVDTSCSSGLSIPSIRRILDTKSLSIRSRRAGRLNY